MYRLEPKPEKLKNVIAHCNMLVNIPDCSDWWWIDAIQMGMPVLAKLGKTTGDTRYWEKMWLMYEYTRNRQDGGLWNAEDGLWWRDHDFNPPYKEPNGEDCYWGRGNGWVVAALVRVMDEIPETETHYNDYKADLIAMCEALVKVQREDGFWNCSLHDPNNFGEKETSGTALFIYGMAWGVRKGYLPADKYMPVITKAWNAMVKYAVHPDGFLGYIQGTGKEPKDSQPTLYDKAPDFEDFGLGCFLLCGSEVYKLSMTEK
jgi:rhamnogalacturonyl hydrolase YesR